MLEVKICRIRPGAVIPGYMSAHAAGMDLCAALDRAVILQPGERSLIPTGIAMEIPVGFEGQVRPRSGLALRQGISMVNSPGTIDADYRGEIGIILINHGQAPVNINPGERIAQLVIAPTVQADLKVVESLSETVRGNGGFGHTGMTDRKGA